MALRSLFLGVLVLAGGSWQQPQPAVAPASGHLRWARGIVAAVSPDSLTLTLRDNTLTLAIDSTTEMVGASAADPAPRAPADLLVVGSVIEAHYTDTRNLRRAVLIVGALADGQAALSGRPGRSYRGTIRNATRGRVSMLVDTRTRGVRLDRRTKLIDTDGRSLAVGSKAITDLLPAGEDVLVTYVRESGDGMFTFSDDQRAIEIRKLRHAGT